jgi:hypothetical protein
MSDKVFVLKKIVSGILSKTSMFVRTADTHGFLKG